jgi:hypothetical protein
MTVHAMFETRVIIVVYGSLAAIVACLIWLIIKSSVSPERKVKTRRDELLEASQRIERQIEILEYPIRGRPPHVKKDIEKLRQVLAQINIELEAASGSSEQSQSSVG